MPAKSQKFRLFDSPEQMEPLLPGEHRVGPLLEQAGDLIRAADQLAGMCQPGALAGLRTLLRSMNSYYSNKIEGQHTLACGTGCRFFWRGGAASTARCGAAKCRCWLFRRPYDARLDAADESRAGDLDGRGNLSERALEHWIGYVLEQCLDQIRFMTGMLDLPGMKERIAACLSFEQNVVKQGVRTDALRALHDLFATQGELERADFKAMLGLGERLATAQVAALLKRGLVETDSPYGKLRFGVPQHALRFYFPRLWPEAEAGG